MFGSHGPLERQALTSLTVGRFDLYSNAMVSYKKNTAKLNTPHCFKESNLNVLKLS